MIFTDLFQKQKRMFFHKRAIKAVRINLAARYTALSG